MTYAIAGSLIRPLISYVCAANNLPSAIVLYDYIDTLEDELSMIWHRHWTSVTWLFATNRYLLVISTALQCLPYPSFQVGSHALFHDLIVTECAAYVPVDLQRYVYTRIPVCAYSPYLIQLQENRAIIPCREHYPVRIDRWCVPRNMNLSQH